MNDVDNKYLNTRAAKKLSLQGKSTNMQAAKTDNKDTVETDRKAVKELSAQDIFLDAFTKRVDKENNIKPARITKVNLKLLSSFEEVEPFKDSVIDSIIESANFTDRSLDCLIEIFLALTAAQNCKANEVLLDLCIRIASGVWINQHEGSLNLFKDLFNGSTEFSDPITYLNGVLDEKYKKRIAGLSRIRTTTAQRDEAEVLSGGSASNKTRVEGGDLTKKILEKQKENIFLMGAFWLCSHKKSESDEHAISDVNKVANFLLPLVAASSPGKTNYAEVALFLANQCIEPSGPTIRTLSMAQADVQSLREANAQLRKQIDGKDQQISVLNKKESLQSERITESNAKAASLQAEIDSLKQAIKDLDLDERAKRTHLRDSEGQVRSKAFNLLSEDVLMPLELALSALKREKPKSELAAHQIELAVESIERELKWFSE